MADVTLRDVLARSPEGLGGPLGAWLVIRIADAMSGVRAPTPEEVRVTRSGAVIVDPPRAASRSLAPELAGGNAPTPRSAVYALGVLLIEIAAGRPPTARQLAEDDIPALSGRARDASEALDRIAGRALSRTASLRYASPAELAAALDRFLVDELHDVGPAVLAKAVEEVVGARAFQSFHPPATTTTEASRIAAAELDIKPPPRSSHPAKPRLDPGLVRLGDHDRAAGAGITDAALLAGAAPKRAKLDVDSEAARRRPGTLLEETPAEPPGRNWILYLVFALAGLLVLVLLYQYVVRPYLLT